ncbi:BREX system P-loop protein BrxC [Marinilactibacillus sp. Marseille-P9653]|uniref:BREX system P-loop protein BrxC n=1 Tax=Marinilactibacillus sp. Marseille-P9653 TaxID=2866583 RepID=UPI001CE3D262|nr:BREX system P-loop protein BrxC [Marinilactibacillus sp. Marseille-P9653]
MNIEQLFKKDITRDIQGVIKIGQEEKENIRQELEEYVVTEELARHFETFFHAYRKTYQYPTDKVGVWISGFFGSGKSHFLKILSYLLNSTVKVDQQQPFTYFKDKIHHSKTLEQMKEIASLPSEVVLFNIDSKTEADSKLNKEGIVKVFNKVFNEMRGYSASIPWLAQLEETLETNGDYEAFKSAFKEETTVTWEEGRDEYYYNLDEIITALAKGTQMSEESARKWIEEGEQNYSISVDSFAKRLKKYLESKEEDFRLIFAADEVGQYISNNTQLMLNLQTVVEDLGKYCHGKIWVLVTSQQDIDSLSENLSATDFSKIQGRFNTRINLSSANADEVIKVRLLEKRETAVDSLALTFDEQETALRNKLEFDDNVPKGFRFYSDQESFISVYPFVPYQFHLLQKVFTSIREHGSAGKHLSDGERNLLESIQQATIEYKDKEIGQLIPFSTFYTHIDQALEHSVRSTIIKATQNEALNEFDVSVLKLLFLIRYIDEMPGTLKNITTLMTSHVDQDTIELQKQISQTMKLLEKEFYVQRIGNNYQFLTNEEQDVNREIGNIHFPTSDLVHEVGKLLVEELLAIRKFAYRPFQDKPSIEYLINLSQWIDDRGINNLTTDLGIRFLTVYSEIAEETEMIALSQREPKVVVRIPDEYDFGELRHVHKINLYLREQSSKTKTPLIEEINARKGQERNKISAAFKAKLKMAIEESVIYVNGFEVEVKGPPLLRIEEGLRLLVESFYPKLSYIVKNYTKDQLEKLITDDQMNMIDEQFVDDNRQATEEIERYLNTLHDRNMDVTLLEIIERYSKEPYGWKELDILATLSHLIIAERIVLLQHSRKMVLSEDHFLRQILKKNVQERIVVKKRKTIDTRIMNQARQLISDVFGITALGEKEEDIAQTIRERFSREQKNLELLETNYRTVSFPERNLVREGLNLVQKVVAIEENIELLTYLAQNDEQVMETMEELEDVKSFFSTSQKSIYEKAVQANLLYLEDQHYLDNLEIDFLAKTIQEILNLERPYSRIKELNDLIDRFNMELGQHLENVTAPIKDMVDQDKSDIEKLLQELDGYSEQDKINRSYQFKISDLEQKMIHAKTVGKIRSFENESQQIKNTVVRQIDEAKQGIYERQEAERQRIVKDKSEQEDKVDRSKSEVDSNGNSVIEEATGMNSGPNTKLILKPKPEKSYVMSRSDLLPKRMVDLRTEDDIDGYLQVLRTSLLEKLEQADVVKLT